MAYLHNLRSYEFYCDYCGQEMEEWQYDQQLGQHACDECNEARCPECGDVDFTDERIKGGLKCSRCAYYGETHSLDV